MGKRRRVIEAGFRFPALTGDAVIFGSFDEDAKPVTPELVATYTNRIVEDEEGFTIIDTPGGVFAQLGGTPRAYIFEFKLFAEGPIWRVFKKQQRTPGRRFRPWINSGVVWARRDEGLTIEQGSACLRAFIRSGELPDGLSARDVTAEVFK